MSSSLSSSSARRRGLLASGGGPAAPDLGRRRTRTQPTSASMSSSVDIASLSLSHAHAPPQTRSRAHEPPVSAQARLATLAHFISDNKWSAFADHIAAYPRDAKVTDPRTGRPLLYHALDLHRNDFARFLLAAYTTCSASCTSEPPMPTPIPSSQQHAGRSATSNTNGRLVSATDPSTTATPPGSSAVSFVGDISSTLLAMHPASHPLRSGSPMSSASSSPVPPPPRHLPGYAQSGTPLKGAPVGGANRPTSFLQSPYGSLHSTASNNPHAALSSASSAYRSPIRDFEGNSPLMVATRAKNTDMCEELLERWADMLHAANVHGMTPLLAACQVGSEMLVTLFLDLGASLSHADNDGNTALHHAAAYNHFSIVALLVARGANFMVRNRKRWTPLDYAYSETLQAFFQDLVRDSVLGGGDFGGDFGGIAGASDSPNATVVVPGTGSVLYSSPLMPAVARKAAGVGAGGGAATPGGSVNHSARSVVTLNDAGGWLSGGAGHGLPTAVAVAAAAEGGANENHAGASPALALDLPALDMSYFSTDPADAATANGNGNSGEGAAKPTLRSYNAFLD